VESLTASEHRIAAMAAEGMSNRDIAQALFVTVKTVETHLRSPLRQARPLGPQPATRGAHGSPAQALIYSADPPQSRIWNRRQTRRRCCTRRRVRQGTEASRTDRPMRRSVAPSGASSGAADGGQTASARGAAWQTSVRGRRESAPFA
jgi:hypothetical protein